MSAQQQADAKRRKQQARERARAEKLALARESLASVTGALRAHDGDSECTLCAVDVEAWEQPHAGPNCVLEIGVAHLGRIRNLFEAGGRLVGGARFRQLVT